MKNKGKYISLLGTILILFVIFLSIPFTIPKLLGFEIYSVLTESMEPNYPVGSLVYVKEIEQEKIEIGDVITFTLGSDTSYVMTHRVVEIKNNHQLFVTKGDNNAVVDADPVSVERIIGTVRFSLSYLAFLLDFMKTPLGITLTIVIFGLAVICWIIGDMLKKIEVTKN